VRSVTFFPQGNHAPEVHSTKSLPSSVTLAAGSKPFGLAFLVLHASAVLSTTRSKPFVPAFCVSHASAVPMGGNTPLPQGNTPAVCSMVRGTTFPLQGNALAVPSTACGGTTFLPSSVTLAAGCKPMVPAFLVLHASAVRSTLCQPRSMACGTTLLPKGNTLEARSTANGLTPPLICSKLAEMSKVRSTTFLPSKVTPAARSKPSGLAFLVLHASVVPSTTRSKPSGPAFLVPKAPTTSPDCQVPGPASPIPQALPHARSTVRGTTLPPQGNTPAVCSTVCGTTLPPQGNTPEACSTVRGTTLLPRSNTRSTAGVMTSFCSKPSGPAFLVPHASDVRGTTFLPPRSTMPALCSTACSNTLPPRRTPLAARSTMRGNTLSPGLMALAAQSTVPGSTFPPCSNNLAARRTAYQPCSTALAVVGSNALAVRLLGTFLAAYQPCSTALALARLGQSSVMLEATLLGTFLAAYQRCSTALALARLGQSSLILEATLEATVMLEAPLVRSNVILGATLVFVVALLG
jgi:hypothetical protein